MFCRLTASFATLAVLVLLVGCGQSDGPKTAHTPAYSPGKLDPNDPEFKKRVQARLDAMKQEESVREVAPWFGQTGLSDETERELPRYVRREFGHLLSQPGPLKASDLAYAGAFVQGAQTVRFWRIHYGSPEPKFAYVVSGPNDRQLIGWGDRAPPK